MRIFLILIFFIFSLKAAEFITEEEYAKALYNNPRGISCKLCHGENGKENILSSYNKAGKKILVIIPSIDELSFDEFEDFMNKDRGVRSIMPSYSLTKSELIALFLYIQSRKEKNEKK